MGNKMNEFIDKYGMITVLPDGDPADNGIEFNVAYDKLWRIRQNYDYPPVNIFFSIEKLTTDFRSFTQRPNTPNDPGSHDNMTAIMSWFKENKKHFEILRHTLEKIEILPRYKHPRDFVYYYWVRGRWYDRWSIFFLWIVTICCLDSCINTYKYRPALEKCLWTFCKTGKWPVREKMIQTDGKILAWLRSYGIMPITWYLCNKILQRKYKTKYPMHEVFKIYFKHPEHPIRKISEGVV